jgi:hypothetical protein
MHERTPVSELYRDYWAAFREQTETLPASSWMRRLKSEQREYWMRWLLEVPGIHLAAVILMPTRTPSRSNRVAPPNRASTGIRVELSLIKQTLGEDAADAMYQQLLRDLPGFEGTVGDSLESASHSHNQHQIGKTFPDCDPTCSSDWPRQHKLLFDWLNRMYDAFGANA